MRSGEDWNLREVNGRFFAPITGRQPTSRLKAGQGRFSIGLPTPCVHPRPK
jgi:hypothetical protein